MNHFAQLEELFSAFLPSTVSGFSDSEIAEVRHFLAVGEYGVALETAIGIYQEEKKSPNAVAIALIKQLAEAMQLEPGTVLSRLSSPDLPGEHL